MPYRIDLGDGDDDVLETLIELGALDVERSAGRGIAALMPDGVAPQDVARALGRARVAVSPALGRDEDSVWVLSPRPVSAGRIRILPATSAPEAGVLRLIDSIAFGTGLHPTTA